MKKFFAFSSLKWTFLYLVMFDVAFLAACSGLTGWRIPGTEKGADATTTVYLVLENVETIPEEVRGEGEIYVDGAFFGNTSQPAFSRYVGNELVVGQIQIQKEKTHTISVRYPGYMPFEVTRYFGTLREYSVTFSLKRILSEGSSEIGKRNGETL